MTRAREEAQIYASNETLVLDGATTATPLDALADLLGRAQLDVPSLETPLAHEDGIERSLTTALERSP